MNLTSMINRALDVGISSLRQYTVNPLWGRRVSTPVLLTASQNLAIVAERTRFSGASLLGPELAVDGYTRVTLWGTLTPNTATGIRFACYGRHTSGGTDHCLPIYNPAVAATPYYLDWTYEEMRYADTTYAINFAMTWDVSNTVPFIQFGVGATTQPGAVGVLTNVNVTYGWGS